MSSAVGHSLILAPARDVFIADRVVNYPAAALEIQNHPENPQILCSAFGSQPWANYS